MADYMLHVHSTREHFTIAHCQTQGRRFILNRVTPGSGPMPDCQDLEGQTFKDLESIERTVTARMRDEGREATPSTTLSRVMLAREIGERWLRKAAEAIHRIPGGPTAEDVPDEQVAPQSDGSLLIWVDLPSETVDLRVPPESWAWRGH
ncbi:hypothetical protein [Thioalkalivibrio sp. ALE23]|uniref:hypothetical protein n=1 Tax=Thioalkalivibrio sp. ALE23 TaxID=1265495 RepID=UPI00035E0DF7|nr:hypothetical protein [Thioalkalivibrio sp. ALE23]